MMERLKYQNHINQVIDFGQDGIYINTSDLHDYEWEATTRNNRISGFARGVTEKTLPVIIAAETAEAGISARNKLFSVAEQDILANRPGRIIVGGYYYPCFVTKSKKKSYQTNKRSFSEELTLISDSPFWIKETGYSFLPVEGEAFGGIDYPFDFPFDYLSKNASKTLTNNAIADANFVLSIFGSTTSPEIAIAGHIYRVNCDIPSGYRVDIDSSDKTIYMVSPTGEKSNQFANRYKPDYIFQRIPVGESPVAWNGEFAFSIVLKDERSEPLWI